MEPEEVESSHITTGRCKAFLPDGRIQTVVYTCTPTGYTAVVQYHKAETAGEINQTDHNDNRDARLPNGQLSVAEVNGTIEKAIITPQKDESIATTTTTAPLGRTDMPASSSSISPIAAALLLRKQPDSIAQHRFAAPRNRLPAPSIPSLPPPPTTTTAPDTNPSASSTPSARKQKKTTWRI